MPIRRGRIKMRNRAVWFLVGIVLVCVLALFGTGLTFAALHGALGTSVGAQGPVSQDTTALGVTHIYMRHEAFSPARIQVPVGATVTWTNQDGVSHSVVLSPVVISASGGWESGLISSGQSFSYTFTSPGTFRYFCQEHPGIMIGIVTVT